MQAMMETIFDICYLTAVIVLGILMIRGARGRRQTLLFGVMAVVLGCGDAFHLIPRAYALCTTGLEANAGALGVGKLITSVTMTVFYVLLYHIWRERYQVQGRKGLTYAVYGLALLRVARCAFPQNDWLSASAPVSWGIYRNLPFAALGLLLIFLFFRSTRQGSTRQAEDRSFRFLWLAIVLSFGFYILVVLFSNAAPAVGILMIPKTLAYVWIVVMGYRDMKKTK